jgi:hypothetical protein
MNKKAHTVSVDSFIGHETGQILAACSYAGKTMKVISKFHEEGKVTSGFVVALKYSEHYFQKFQDAISFYNSIEGPWKEDES